MQNLFSNIVRLSLVASLTDKELFVNKLTGILEGFQDDPEKAEKIARFLTEYLNNTKQKMTQEKIIRNAMSDANLPNDEDVQELTKAINQLTQELQKSK